MKSELVGYVCMFLGIGAVLGGIHFGTGGVILGWVGVAIGLALVGVAFVRLKAPARE